jgi:hypothetical protein
MGQPQAAPMGMGMRPMNMPGSPPPLAPGQPHLAHGGQMQFENYTPLSSAKPHFQSPRFADGGASRFHDFVHQGGLPMPGDFSRTPAPVTGAGDGQSDSINAKLSDGEYVIDADSVAALGNGSNKAGAQQLDKMIQNLRTHKRSAPAHSIPPAAKAPHQYMKGK